MKEFIAVAFILCMIGILDRFIECEIRKEELGREELEKFLREEEERRGDGR